MARHNYATDPPPDLSKQSKWLQEYFEDMRRDLVRKDEKIKALSNLHPGSNVVMGGRVGEPDTTLPPNSRIFFYAGEGRDMLTNMIEVRFDHQGRNGDRLYISSYGSGGLRIMPNASNSFYLELDSK